MALQTYPPNQRPGLYDPERKPGIRPKRSHSRKSKKREFPHHMRIKRQTSKRRSNRHT